MSNHETGAPADAATTTFRPPMATGADVLRAIARGELPPPPAALLLDLELIDVGDGETTFGFVARPEIGNPDHAHGGILAAIADFAVATAVWSQQPADARIVTADLHVSYFRPVELDGASSTCTGRVVHIGRTQVNATAEIRGSGGGIHAMAMATCRVAHPRRVPDGAN